MKLFFGNFIQKLELYYFLFVERNYLNFVKRLIFTDFIYRYRHFVDREPSSYFLVLYINLLLNNDQYSKLIQKLLKIGLKYQNSFKTETKYDKFDSYNNEYEK